MINTEELVITFLDFDPSEPCSSKFGCSNEAVWKYRVESDHCNNTYVLCDKCKCEDEITFREMESRPIYCLTHREVVSIHGPIRMGR